MGSRTTLCVSLRFNLCCDAVFTSGGSTHALSLSLLTGSIFMQGVSPPYVHIHLRISDAQSVPLGLVRPITSSNGETTGVEDATEEEKATFDTWLREDRWRKKDDLMDRYYRDGDFVGGKHKRDRQAASVGRSASKTIYVAEDNSYVEIPVHLRGLREIGDLFCWFAPVLTGLAAWHAYGYLARRL